jgi:probable F420-dependent oxidoreductase
MKFIIGVPIGGPTYSPADIGTIARRADELGFDAINGSERLIMPRHIESKYPYGPKGDIPGVGTLQNTLEILSVMAFVAGQTSQIRLMPSVIVLPYRNPILAAKILATIDQLSNGRLVVGCGVGWSVEEAQALMVPTPFEKRGAVSNEYIRAWKELWSKEEPEFHGKFLDISDVDFAPKTVQQPSPPFWVGGESPAAMRRAATLCDGWLPSNSNPIYPLETTEQFTDAVSRLRRLLEAQGRDPHDFVIRFGGASWDGDVSKKDQVADEIRGWAKLGVTHQNFGGGSSVAERLEMMESFVTEVFPLVHD